MIPPGVVLDPVTLSLLNAPVDDEPVTEEDRADIAASDADIRCGRKWTVLMTTPSETLRSPCRWEPIFWPTSGADATNYVAGELCPPAVCV